MTVGVTPTRPHETRYLPFLLIFFFASGCAALIYEIIWFQLLQLVIGLTTVSLAVLLGSYMGGMCLGSLLSSRFLSHQRHPLRVYAFLELGIAIIGLAMPFALPPLTQWYTAAGAGGFSGMLLRALIAGCCLLPPTVLMGATLPTIAKWFQLSRTTAAPIGLLYAANTAGAVLGCLSAGFYLLRLFDMTAASFVPAMINLGIALSSWILSRSPKTQSPAAFAMDNADRREAANRTTSKASARSWNIYLTIALSGLTALGAEVVWTRLLSLMMGGSVYTFSIILAIFLIGLALGSGAGALLCRSNLSPLLALVGCQMALVPAITWTTWALADFLPYWPINPSLSPSIWFNFQMDLARTLWAIFPATLFWGASFPLALACVSTRDEDSNRATGRLYAANTFGSILGALVFSLALIPLLGTQNSQRILIVLPVLSAFVGLVPGFFRSRVPRPETLPSNSAWLAPALTGFVLLSAVLAFSASPLPWAIAAYGRFMPTYVGRLAPKIIPEGDVPSEGTPDIFCTYLGEGLNGTVAVTKWTSGTRNFHSAGKVQASNDPRDMRLQRMLGHLSAIAHAKPESVLVVACGAGVTAGSFVVHPDVKRIVICDIEPLVPQVIAPMFAKENYDVVRDPRTRIVIDDGRHFIRTTKEKFDVITSDPIDPWVKGCAALNTIEYYQMCKAHLKPGGVMSLWIPLYENDTATVKSMIATFFKVFPNGILWSNDDKGDGYDAVLFAQVEPTQIDLDQLHQRLARADHERVRDSLKEAGFTNVTDLIATYAGQARDLQEWMRDAEINTDRNLRLQYLAGMSLNTYMGSEILSGITRYKKFPDNLFTGSGAQKQALRARMGLRAPVVSLLPDGNASSAASGAPAP